MRFMMRSIIWILAVIIAAGTPAAARCCSLGGGASYDYLGDSSLNIDMSSYDEFLRDNAPPKGLAARPDSDQKASEVSSLKLNLSDNSRMEISIESAGKALAGRGNLTSNNETLALQAEGDVREGIIQLNATALDGELFRFNLEREGSQIQGDYHQILPDGREANGTAEGCWEAASSSPSPSPK